MLTEPMNLKQNDHFCVLTTCRHASGALCGTCREATQGTELCPSLAQQGEVGAQPPLGAAPLPREGTGHRAHRQPVPGPGWELRDSTGRPFLGCTHTPL